MGARYGHLESRSDSGRAGSCPSLVVFAGWEWLGVWVQRVLIYAWCHSFRPMVSAYCPYSARRAGHPRDIEGDQGGMASPKPAGL